MQNLRNVQIITQSKHCEQIFYIKQGVSNHGKPEKVMEFHCLFPGLEKSWKLTTGFGKFIKVMEIKRHPLAKWCCSFLSSSISVQGYVYVIRSNFGVFHIFMYYDWNLVSGSQRQNRRELVDSVGARDLSTCLCHATKHVEGP